MRLMRQRQALEAFSDGPGQIISFHAAAFPRRRYQSFILKVISKNFNKGAKIMALLKDIRGFLDPRLTQGQVVATRAGSTPAGGYQASASYDSNLEASSHLYTRPLL